MINEGIATDGDLNSARKSYAYFVGICSIQKMNVRFNQNITFGEEDLISLVSIHDDVVVISNIRF